MLAVSATVHKAKPDRSTLVILPSIESSMSELWIAKAIAPSRNELNGDDKEAQTSAKFHDVPTLRRTYTTTYKQPRWYSYSPSLGTATEKCAQRALITDNGGKVRLTVSRVVAILTEKRQCLTSSLLRQSDLATGQTLTCKT